MKKILASLLLFSLFAIFIASCTNKGQTQTWLPRKHGKSNYVK